MEVVAFVVLCMAIIAQISAAPTPESGSGIAHYNNEFELPPMARGGFKMTLNVSICTEYINIKDELKIVLLPDAKGDQTSVNKYCGNKNETTGTRICIMPKEAFRNRSGKDQLPTFQTAVMSIKARPNPGNDILRLSFGLDGYQHEYVEFRLEEFEDFKHFSLAGIEEIQTLQFVFTN